MRIVKDASERRNEILDAAGELFMSQGYDSTSTNQIMDKVGIARGTLYYHFKSKEEIMNALIERYILEIAEGARAIANDKSIPALERFLRVIKAIRIEGEVGEPVMEHIHKPQNALMHQKMNQAIIHAITPIFTDIVKDGIQDGIFETPYAYECMEMVITYSNIAFDTDVIEMTKEERDHKMKAMFYNAERLLHAPQGSITNTLFD